MTIYLDVVFLENLFMDYIILFATGLINKVDLKITRIAVSSIIGSLYAVLSLTAILDNNIGITIKIMLSVAMIYIAFKPENLKKCLKQLTIFYLTSFTFGGVAFALLYFIKPGDLLIKNGVYIGTYPIKIALLGGMIGFVIITIAFKLIKGKISQKDMIYKLELQIEGKKQKVNALLDTGNLLKEPITKIPVVIVEKEKMENILPTEVISNVNKIIEGNIDDKLKLENYIKRFRIIPFSSLGKQNGLLLGIKADYVKIELEDEEIINKNVILGIYDGNLSKSNSYHALIGLDVIQERGVENEHFRNVKV